MHRITEYNKPHSGSPMHCKTAAWGSGVTKGAFPPWSREEFFGGGGIPIYALNMLGNLADFLAVLQ